MQAGGSALTWLMWTMKKNIIQRQKGDSYPGVGSSKGGGTPLATQRDL